MSFAADMPTTTVWEHDVPTIVFESARLVAVACFGAVIGMRALTETLLVRFCQPTGVSMLTRTMVDTSACTPVRETAGAWILMLALLGTAGFAVGIGIPWVGGAD